MLCKKNDTCSISGNVIGSEAKMSAKCCSDERSDGILGDPGADSGGEGKSKRAEKCGTKKSKELREELFSPFFTFLRSIYIFPPV